MGLASFNRMRREKEAEELAKKPARVTEYSDPVIQDFYERLFRYTKTQMTEMAKRINLTFENPNETKKVISQAIIEACILDYGSLPDDPDQLLLYRVPDEEPGDPISGRGEADQGSEEDLPPTTTATDKPKAIIDKIKDKLKGKEKDEEKEGGRSDEEEKAETEKVLDDIEKETENTDNEQPQVQEVIDQEEDEDEDDLYGTLDDEEGDFSDGG